MSARYPKAVVALTTATPQPNAEKALVCSRNLTSIVSSEQKEVTKAAETQITEPNCIVMLPIEDITKNAPGASKNAIAITKSVIGNANADYEKLTKTTQKTVKVLAANLNTTVSKFSDADVQADTTKKQSTDHNHLKKNLLKTKYKIPARVRIINLI